MGVLSVVALGLCLAFALFERSARSRTLDGNPALSSEMILFRVASVSYDEDNYQAAILLSVAKDFLIVTTDNQNKAMRSFPFAPVLDRQVGGLDWPVFVPGLMLFPTPRVRIPSPIPRPTIGIVYAHPENELRVSTYSMEGEEISKRVIGTLWDPPICDAAWAFTLKKIIVGCADGSAIAVDPEGKESEGFQIPLPFSSMGMERGYGDVLSLRVISQCEINTGCYTHLGWYDSLIGFLLFTNFSLYDETRHRWSIPSGREEFRIGSRPFGLSACFLSSDPNLGGIPLYPGERAHLSHCKWLELPNNNGYPAYPASGMPVLRAAPPVQITPSGVLLTGAGRELSVVPSFEEDPSLVIDLTPISGSECELRWIDLPAMMSLDAPPLALYFSCLGKGDKSRTFRLAVLSPEEWLRYVTLKPHERNHFRGFQCQFTADFWFQDSAEGPRVVSSWRSCAGIVLPVIQRISSTERSSTQ